MKQLKLKKNSWHYYLATKLGGFDDWRNDTNDLCAYMWCVFKGHVVLAGLTAGFASIAFMLMHMIFGFYFSLLAGEWVMSDVGMIALIVIASVSSAVVVVALHERLVELNRKRSKHDSFVRNSYKSLKEKTCVPIDFID